ncbi:MAG: starch-binding protein [Ruminococcus sp.]|nr:starch-binding protein [Ruminococcus sp.]
MINVKKILAVILALAIIASITVVSASAAKVDKKQTAAGGITVHCYSDKGTPNIYYWNSLPNNISTNYPGPSMTSEGSGWYRYSFSNLTKINMLFVTNGVQSDEQSRETGEWWFKNNRWYSKDPAQSGAVDRTDMREDSIYFLMTTRFYDGDKSNNIHCWDDAKANNPDTDPAWRGDFKGLIQKLDYIKAMGFTAIWITPVVDNASGYDYHGYHACDFAKVDERYESSGATYQDLIDAAHAKGMKIVQDVVWNHSGNFGENYLEKMFNKKIVKGSSSVPGTYTMDVIKGSNLDKNYPNYDSMKPDPQFQARLDTMKAHQGGKYSNLKDHYHRETSMGYETEIEQTGSMAGDCVDINTENPEVAKYITNTYKQYVDMGVDAFRLDTEKHINRWTLNSAYFPEFSTSKYKNFFLFGEVCARVREVWNHGLQSDAPAFYGWKETGTWTNNWSNTDWKANLSNSLKHFNAYANSSGAPTSSNALLNGTTYHTPDYSKSNGTGVIDFLMHWAFRSAREAYGSALGEDQYFNDSTWNVMYVDSHDYGPDGQEKTRFQGGTQAWAENMNLIFTFRGIPCIFYGSEVEFKNDMEIDVGPNKPLENTGRAYYGDYLEGNVTASDFGKYTASGNVQSTLNKPLAQHLRKLNMIRRAVPALQKGQYKSVGDMCFIRRYTSGNTDSVACVAISGGATFSGIPNGRYVDAVTGDVKQVSGGSLTTPSIAQGNMRVYVKDLYGKIGDTTTYLK